MTSYNTEEPNSNTMYLEFRNLYRWALTQCLPTGNFSWVPEDQLECLDVMTIANYAAPDTS